MEIKLAGDLMIPLDEYPQIPYWYSMYQAMEELEKYEFDIEGRKSLPRQLMVFNEEYQLLGVVRRRDIFRGLDPNSLARQLKKIRKKMGDRKEGGAPSDLLGRLANTIRERLERPVTDIMRRSQVAVNMDDDFLSVISEMVNSDLSLLPVEKEGEVVGVIRSVDVFSELVGLLES